MTRYVLSIDGGGIRGIIAARVLCELEKIIQKPIGEIFNFFSGSSVGAIIAAALTTKTSNGKPLYRATEVFELLLKYGPVLFSTSMIRNLLSIFSGARFSSSSMEKVLKHFFGDLKIGDLAANFMVPSYDVTTRSTIVIRSWVSLHRALKVRDVLRAACAAPTIFTPKALTINNRRHLLVDSGLVANNPAVCAYAAVDFLYPGEEVYILSLGCGGLRNQHKEVICRGLGFWILNIALIFLDAGMEAVDYQMIRILGQEHYIRITGMLHKASNDFTDASTNNICALQEDAERIVKENMSEIERFAVAYFQGAE
ncbi:MAG: patatin-like phospholipase family protein [Aaplasma endosymbiont of Hyalomma asiaticum]